MSFCIDLLCLMIFEKLGALKFMFGTSTES